MVVEWLHVLALVEFCIACWLTDERPCCSWPMNATRLYLSRCDRYYSPTLLFLKVVVLLCSLYIRSVSNSAPLVVAKVACNCCGWSIISVIEIWLVVHNNYGGVVEAAMSVSILAEWPYGATSFGYCQDRSAIYVHLLYRCPVTWTEHLLRWNW